MKEHYCWPDLGEAVVYKDFAGIVTSRHSGLMEMSIRNADGISVHVKLEDFIVDQIRNPR